MIDCLVKSYGCVVILSVIRSNIVMGQFPRLCTTTEAISIHECCPPINGSGSPCGEDEGRGRCDAIVIDGAQHGPQYALVGIDDREKWPERFFNRTCFCNGNFGGFDCSRCKFGWQGDNCQDRRPLSMRQNILNMTESKRTIFLNVLDQSKTTTHPDYVIARDHYRNLMGENGTDPPNFVNISIYNLFVWMHYYSVRDTLLGPGQAYTAIDFSHEGPAFLTWHRMHLLMLETDLQKMTGDPSFTLPYWNFATGESKCDICTDNLLGGKDEADVTMLGRNSRFADWDVVCLSLDWFNDNVKLCNGTLEGPIRRNPGGNVDRPSVQILPTPEDVVKCLQVDEYDTPPFFTDSDGSFRNTLEGYAAANGQFDEGVRSLHNLAHLFLNGTGGITHASANDPLFVLLHTYTDAIFDEWMTRTNTTSLNYPQEGAPIGHNLNFNMVPFFPPVSNKEMFRPAEELGYSYAIILPGTIASSGDSAPSFLWAIVGVSGFIILAAVVIVTVSLASRYRRHKREENLYQSLISDDLNKGVQYTS